MSRAEFSMTSSSNDSLSLSGDAAKDLPAPADLGGWQPVAFAAEGTMARIYRAKAPGTIDSGDGRADPSEPAYALKVLKESWSDNERAVELFATEAQLGRTIANPHVVSVLTSRVKLGQKPYYLVMPWLEGRTLREELRRRGQFGLAEALWVARQVAEAIGAIHQAGYYHGDLKPSNLFWAPNGHVTLLDLGFARRLPEARAISEELVAGTYLYMAPEVFGSVYASGVQSDIYSLGVVLFELFAGRPPFLGDSVPELVELHRTARAPRLSRLRPGVPPYLCDFVERLLSKQPDRRPSFSDGLIDELARLEIRTFSERAA